MHRDAQNGKHATTRLDRAFFARDAETVAKALIGTILVRRVRGKEFRARLVEVEAYLGPHDLALREGRRRVRRALAQARADRREARQDERLIR